MALNRTPVWLTLAATIFVAAHASALETLPGEPPVEDKYQTAQERAAGDLDWIRGHDPSLERGFRKLDSVRRLRP